MKKLMPVVLMLFILTVFVSGASATPQKSDTKYTISVFEYTDTYATASPADEQSEAYANTYAAVVASENKGGKEGFAIGATQAHVDGGSGSNIVSAQNIGGTLS